MSKKSSSRSKPPSALRERAEAALRASRPDMAGMSPEEIQNLVRELQVHQIELGIQNEELRASQLDLARSRDRFHDLYDFAPFGYVTIDGNGTIVEANLTAAAMLGIERQKLVRCKFTQFVAPDGRDAFDRLQRAALDCEDKQAGDLLLRRQDGVKFFARMEAVCFRESVTRAPHWRSAIIDISRQKAAEEQIAAFSAMLEKELAQRTTDLRESEERYRLLADNSEDFVALLDIQGNKLYLSPSYYRRTGWSREEVRSSNWADRHHPDDLPLIERSLAANLAGETTCLKHRILCRDGSWIWVEVNCRPLRDEEGKISRLVLWSHDITQRKQAEAALVEGQQLLSALIESAMDAIVSVDAAMGVVLFNHAAEMMFQCPAAEAMGQPLDRFLPARFRESHAAHIGNFGKSGETSRRMGSLGTVIGLRGNGEEFPVEASISHIESDGNKVYTVFLRDITNRVRNEAVLQRQAQLLQLSHDAIFVWSTNGGIEFWNQGATRLYGYERDESMGRGPQAVFKSVYGTPWARIEGELRERGEWEGILRRTAKSGDEVVVSSRMQKIATEEGKGMVVLETDRDITERQRLEAALLSASEEERQRIGRDLHDGLGQELTGIALLNSMLLNSLKAKGLPESASAERLAELLTHAAGQVRRVSHGLHPVAPDPDSLMTGLKTLVDDANFAHASRCVLDCDGDVAVHNHDTSNHLYRIAQEALQNALRHGKPGGVVVRLARKDGFVTLEIHDDGAGFDPKTTQSDGIGLETMKHRAETMNGFLEFIRPPEGGTLVRCSAPDPQPAP